MKIIAFLLRHGDNKFNRKETDTEMSLGIGLGADVCCNPRIIAGLLCHPHRHQTNGLSFPYSYSHCQHLLCVPASQALQTISYFKCLLEKHSNCPLTCLLLLVVFLSSWRFCSLQNFLVFISCIFSFFTLYFHHLSPTKNDHYTMPFFVLFTIVFLPFDNHDEKGSAQVSSALVEQDCSCMYPSIQSNQQQRFSKQKKELSFFHILFPSLLSDTYFPGFIILWEFRKWLQAQVTLLSIFLITIFCQFLYFLYLEVSHAHDTSASLNAILKLFWQHYLLQ